MRVLVTGAAGYLGSALCEHLLARGHRVSALDDLSATQGNYASLALCFASDRFEFFRLDARLPEHLSTAGVHEADAVIPLAAVVGAPACDADPDRASAVNLHAVRMLLHCLSPEQRVVFPNTNSGYGSAGDAPCTEESLLRPQSHYAKLKADAEAVVLSRPNAASARLATVFGPSRRPRLDLLVNDFAWRAFTAQAILVREPEMRRNFVHVHDAAAGLAFLAEHPEASGPFNLGCDAENRTKLELAYLVAREIPARVLLDEEGVPDPDRRDYVVSSAKLRVGGFEAKIPVREGVRGLEESFREMTRAWRNA